MADVTTNETDSKNEEFEKLWSHLKIHRERGVIDFVKSIGANPNSSKSTITSLVELSVSGAEEKAWECQHGCLMALKSLAQKGLLDDELITKAAKFATTALGHPEPRVREESGQTLAALCGGTERDLFTEVFGETIMAGIRDNMERDPEEASSNVELLKKFAKDVQAKKVPGKTAQEIFHESAGWRTLETSSKALLEIAKTSGKKFLKHITPEVMQLIYFSLSHTNRFVRETAYYICAEFTLMIHENKEYCTHLSIADFDKEMCKNISEGLGDNWSQVRMAACVAGRRFLLTMSEDERHTYYPDLVPKLVLNRYYVAEGVRLYSQASWKLITGAHGKEIVEKYMAEVVEYYIVSSDAPNHAVREAACACIAELGLKVDVEAVRPFVKTLLNVLLECFRDESWPVRDAACVSCGRFLKSFPEEGREVLDELMSLFFQHVCDNIWSVRENAAISLGMTARVYGDEVFAIIFDKLKELLPQAKVQPKGSKKFAGLQNVTTFGVAPSTNPDANQLPESPRPVPSNVVQAPWVEGGARRIMYKAGEKSQDPSHENQQQFSCGSLAPKLKRKGGCMDCEYARPQEPWEKSDGAVYLMRELAPINPTQVCALLPELAAIAALKEYDHHFHLHETIWKQLPAIVNGVGKKLFKTHFELFIDPLYYALQCPNQLASAAAQDCVAALSKILGPSILRGRIENYNPDFSQAFEQAVVGAASFSGAGFGAAGVGKYPGRGIDGIGLPAAPQDFKFPSLITPASS